MAGFPHLAPISYHSRAQSPKKIAKREAWRGSLGAKIFPDDADGLGKINGPLEEASQLAGNSIEFDHGPFEIDELGNGVRLTLSINNQIAPDTAIRVTADGHDVLSA